MGTQDVLVTSQAAVVNTIKEWQIFPTWTILDIAGLACPGLIIEIKAVAAARS
jgi:hypothetical protein